MAVDSLARRLAASALEKAGSDVTKDYVDTELAKKYDKTGGTITGDVAITGNLTVSGTTTTEKEEQLLVKANVIATNADKVDLQTLLSGLAINKNKDATYGIMYDPVDDTVKFGEGTLDADNKFVFKDGEGHPLAIRADSTKFTDAHLVKWDEATNSFVDAGFALEGGEAELSIQQPPARESFINTIVGYVKNSTEEYPAGKDAYGAYVDPSIYNAADNTTKVENNGERTTMLGGLSASIPATPTEVRPNWYGYGSQSFIHGKRIINVGDQNHIFGTDHLVYGDNSFIAGLRNVATNGEVTMLGTGLIGTRLWQVILGRYNKPSHSFFQIGGGKQVQHIDGTNPDGSNRYVLDSIERKNVLEIDEGGNAILAGRLNIGIEPSGEEDAVRLKELNDGLAKKVNLIPTPATGSILYGVPSSSATGQPQAYTTGTGITAQYAIPQRAAGGQINMPDQTKAVPTDHQAITKIFGDTNYLSLVGGEISGGLSVVGDPVADTDVVRLEDLNAVAPISKLASEWATDTSAVADGQIAISKMKSGRVQLRVGNGKKIFSALKPVAEWYVISDDLGFGTFETAMQVRLTETNLETVEYDFPTYPDDDFYAGLVFNTGDTAPEFITDGDCKITGTHCKDGVFTPRANMHYDVYYWYDGTKQAVVRGVPTNDASYPSTGGATIGAISDTNPPTLEKVIYCKESEIPTNPETGVEYACTDYIAKEDLDVDLQAEIDGKQDKLTFDAAPSASSTNPVTSSGIYNAIANFMTIQVSDSLIGG